MKKIWNREEIETLLIEKDVAVERGIVTLFNNNLFYEFDNEAGTHFGQWLQGFNGRNEKIYPAKSLHNQKAQRRFWKLCIRGELPIDRARRITLIHSNILTSIANQVNDQIDNSSDEFEKNNYILCESCQASYHEDKYHTCLDKEVDDISESFQKDSGKTIISDVDTGHSGPNIATWAHTAQVMSKVFPEGPGQGMDWDMWKDEMKERDL